MEKTQAMRMLDKQRINYIATAYDAGPEFHTAEEAAALLDADPACVYKTLVVLRAEPGAKPLLVIIAAARRIDLRLLANDIGEKKLRMATQHEAERLTGLRVGGISALAFTNRSFEVLLDATARQLDHIHVSAGARGVDIELGVADLVRVTGARYARCTAETIDGGAD